MQPYQRNPNESQRSHSAVATTPFFLQRPTTTTTDRASKLFPVDVDLQLKKNTEEHSTHHYDLPGLVLRRGQSFNFTVTFNRDYNPDECQLFVRLAIGPRSMISKGTQIRVLVDGPSTETRWSAKRIPSEEKNRVSLQVSSPSNAIIGKYSLFIEVRPLKKDEKLPYHPSDLSLFLFEVDLYFLFNPWNKEDACALASSKEIDEYVMNEHGEIYLGSAEKPQVMPWYYGQFERAALLTALSLLDQTQLPFQNRVDPVVILRLISSKICSNPGSNTGIFPSSFDRRGRSNNTHCYTSSAAILKEYLSLKGRSVSGDSGMQWQHAAVLCTLSRSLGIPCRVVTVYNSACRTDGKYSHDIHWDLKQRPLKQLNLDSICSAHVWNECWMRRDDLSGKEQGWQVIDSTPIYMCDGIRRSGPCAVSALKQGQLGYRWDSSFIHSSIHGEKSHWKVYPDGDMELLDIEDNQIGARIITRSLTNGHEPEDITEQYKSMNRSTEAKPSKSDVKIELKVSEEIRFGDEIDIDVNGENQSDEKRTISAALTICVLTRHDQRVITCYNLPIRTVTLQGKQSDKLSLKIRPAQYIHHGRAEDITVQYFLHAEVQESEQIFTRSNNIVFIRDDLVRLTLDEDVVEIGRIVSLKVCVINPMPYPLHNGRLHVDGLGISQVIQVRPFLASRESLLLNLRLSPNRIGTSRLYVTFVADEVSSLTKTIPLEIVREPVRAPEKVNKPEEKKEEPPVEAQPAQEPPLTKAASSSDSTLNSDKQEKDFASDSLTKPESPITDEEGEGSPLKKDSDATDSNTDATPPVVHGSTMSVDSLDVTNEKPIPPTSDNSA